MKRNYVNAISLKNIVRTLFFSIAVVAFSLGANAQAVYASNTNDVNPGAVVTYLGTQDNQMSFRLKFDNETGEKFAVINFSRYGPHPILVPVSPPIYMSPSKNPA